MDNEGDSDLFCPAPKTSRSILAVLLKLGSLERGRAYSTSDG